ncbi:hypothetical protein DMB95_06375 [Campylobacter sp. MIT 12-8780]|nr:hypothetical protein DMB95_06375 [Campylobacter sp. MIT 12-8780]
MYQALKRVLVKEYSVAVLSVDYHCIGSRPQTGAKFYFDMIDRLIIQSSCEALKIKVPQELSQDELTQADIKRVFNDLSAQMQMLKDAKELKEDAKLYIHASLNPRKNEYQNFGLMQAMDICNALLHIKANPPFELAKEAKTIAFGSSHGGYLALLCAKIAPWLIDGVIENSAYIQIPLRLFGFLKELDYITQAEFSLHSWYQHLVISGSTKTHFTSNQYSKNHFKNAYHRIRNILDDEHLHTQALHKKPLIVSYHSAQDFDFIPPSVKIELFEKLRNLGFEAKLMMIENESEVDGKFIKNLNHGMGMSLKILAQKELGLMLAQLHEKPNSAKIKQEISFQSDEIIYTFTQENNALKLSIQRT